MNSQTKAQQPVPFMQPAVLFSRFVLLLTFVDLLGWAFHVASLTSVVPGFSTMKPNTALALGLLAVCCRARKGDGTQSSLKAIPRFAMGIAMTLSCGTLAEYASGKSFGLDGLLFGVPLDRFGDPPGRMALGTALCITLTGLALIFLDRAPRFSVWALLSVCVISVAALLEFVVNRGPLLNVFWLRSLAVPTALCLVMLALATLSLRPERRPVALLFTSKVDAGQNRRWPILGGIALAFLMSLPAVVAMRDSIPEGILSFLMLAVILHSVQGWLVFVDVAHRQTIRND